MIYADHNATTPPLPEVVSAMAAVLADGWGNPGARHAHGRRAQAAIEAARAEVAAMVGGDPAGVVFTSGATEALNLAILGLGERLLPARPRVVTCASEHPAVLAPVARLAEAGAEAVVLPVDHAGRLDPARLEAAIDDRTGLVCLMLANHETGTVHDVAAAAAIAHRHGALAVCDATQAVGRMAVDAAALGVDALACTAHKIYGPQGSGALWLRTGLAPAAQILGGGQERGLRSGTANLPGIVGFGVAAAAARRGLQLRIGHLVALGARLETGIRACLPRVVVQGAAGPRIPGTCMLTLPGLPAGWLATLAGISASGGAACTAGGPSRTLLAMGVDPRDAANSVRLGLGIGTTTDEVDAIIAALAHGAAVLRGEDRP